MTKELRAKLASRNVVAQGTTEAVFAFTDGELRFTAGQYVTITAPGLEHLPIEKQFHDFSIASSPTNAKEIRIAFRDSESPFKLAVLNVALGTEFIIEGPKGIFTLPEIADKPIVFIAGGIGITPFHSMLRYAYESKLSYRITLFYYNASELRTPYLGELMEIAA